MDPVTIALIALRGLAQVFALQGQNQQAGALTDIANAVESGRAVDAHMREVAQALKDGTPYDWDELARRITDETDQFLDR